MSSTIYDIISLYEQTKKEYKTIFEFIDRNQTMFITTCNISKFIIYCYFGYFEIKHCDEEFKWNYINNILSDMFSFYNKYENCTQKDFIEYYENIYKQHIENFSYEFVLDAVILDAYFNLKLQK